MTLIPNFKTDVGNPLKGLEGDSGSDTFSVHFPDNLENLDHWIRFAAVERTEAWRDSNIKTEPLASIYLPIPSKLSTGYAMTYGTEGIGALGTVGAKMGTIAKDLLSGKTSIKDMINTVTTKTAEVAKQEFRGALKEGGALALNYVASGETGLGTGSLNLLKGAMMGAGVAANPHQAMIFQTVEFRKHTFDYQFAAKNPTESEMIKKIIYLFKYHAAPGFIYHGHNFFKYPDEFDISFHYPNYLFTIAPSVLTSLTVDYTGSDQAAFFRDTHAPVHITVHLEFTELTIVTKDRIRDHGR